MIEDGPTTQNTPETHAWLGDLPTDAPAGVARARSSSARSGTPRRSARATCRPILDMTFDFTVASGYVDAASSGNASRASGGSSARITTLYPTRRVRRVPDQPRHGSRRERAGRRPGQAAPRGGDAPDRARRPVRVLRRGDRHDRPEAGSRDPDADALGRQRTRGRVQHARPMGGALGGSPVGERGRRIGRPVVAPLRLPRPDPVPGRPSGAVHGHVHGRQRRQPGGLRRPAVWSRWDGPGRHECLRRAGLPDPDPRQGPALREPVGNVGARWRSRGPTPSPRSSPRPAGSPATGPCRPSRRRAWWSSTSSRELGPAVHDAWARCR